jgi:hypothetical protein
MVAAARRRDGRGWAGAMLALIDLMEEKKLRFIICY